MAQEIDARIVHTVTYQRDDNDTWFVDAVDVPGAHSYGRTITAARANIREAIALVLEIEPDAFDLDEHVHIPDVIVEESLARAVAARQTAEAAAVAARELTIDALRLYWKSDLDLSVRDLGEMLGISFQRVQQLLTEIRELDHAQHR